MASLGVLFLVEYVHRGFRYPIGWDASFYVWRANAVGVDGLARIGAVRAGSPLLLAVLMQTSRQNALTLVAVVPAVLAGVVGLGAAVMVRAALDLKAVWVPVLGILAWAAFVDVGILGGHFDNALNVALVMCGLAAAVVALRGGRGAVAAGVLLAAAGVAEWPFFVFAACILAGALLLFAVLTARATGGPIDLRRVAGVAIALGAAGAVTALTFLAIPAVGGVGAGIADPATRALLRRRFIERVQDWARYLAFPLAIAGGIVAAREPVSGVTATARRMFLCLMVSWTALTVMAGLAQLAGVPVAGGRLTSYFFVVPILTGVLVWWMARRAGEWARPRAGAPVAAILAGGIAVVTVLAFSVATWERTRPWKPWMEAGAVEQTAAAGRYLQTSVPDRSAIFTMTQSTGVSDDTVGRWENVIKASLPGSVARLTRTSLDAPATVADRTAAESGPPVVVVIRRYNESTYPDAASLPQAREVADGVVVVNGPPAVPGVSALTTPEANTTRWGILVTGGTVVLLLFVCGLGWALALLPRDSITVLGLAPSLGLAAITLLALAWDVVGLPLHGLDPLWPFAIATAAGWGAAWWVRRRGAPDPVTLPA
jgi:hypothetical protein